MSYYALLVSVLVTLMSIRAILSGRFGKQIQDIPNERSLHTTPTPRIGGVGLVAGVVCAWLALATLPAWWITVPMLMLFFVSLLDDMRGLTVRQRLAAHLVAAIILVGGSGLLAFQGGVIALAVLLFAVWMTNLYNFMDGSDGLAGGMALFGFGMYGIAALIAHDAEFALLNLSISAAAFGFLYFNFPPAKIFMGDAGSISLGFLAAAMGLQGWQQGYWPAWFTLLAFSPFVVDASITLLKRKLRGVKVTEAHREHYYQRAVQMGWSHRGVALVEYALMAGAGISALFALGRPFPWQVFLIWSGIYGALMLSLDAAWKRFEREQHA